MDLKKLVQDAATTPNEAAMMLAGLVEKSIRYGSLGFVMGKVVEQIGGSSAGHLADMLDKVRNAPVSFTSGSAWVGAAASGMYWKAKYIDKLDTSKLGLFAIDGGWYEQKKPKEKDEGKLIALTRFVGSDKKYDLLIRKDGVHYNFGRNDGTTKTIDDVVGLVVGGNWEDIVTSVHTHSPGLLFDGGKSGTNSGINGGKPAP